MLKYALLIFTACSLFGQATNPLQNFTDGLIRGTQLRIESENARAQQNLMNAQSESIRLQTEQLRLNADSQKRSVYEASPAISLTRDLDFNRLPIAIRVRFAKLVDYEFSKYSDSEISTVLSGLAAGMAAQPAPPVAPAAPIVAPIVPPYPEKKPKPADGPGGG